MNTPLQLKPQSIDIDRLLMKYFDEEKLNHLAEQGSSKVAALRSGKLLILNEKGKTIHTYHPKKGHRMVRTKTNVRIGGWRFRWTNSHGDVGRGVLIISPGDKRTEKMASKGDYKRFCNTLGYLSAKGIVSHDVAMALLDSRELIDEHLRHLHYVSAMHRSDAIHLYLVLLYGDTRTSDHLMSMYAEVFSDNTRLSPDIPMQRVQEVVAMSEYASPSLQRLSVRIIRRAYLAVLEYKRDSIHVK